MIVTSLAGDPVESELGAAQLTRVDPGAAHVFAADLAEQAVVVLGGAASAVGAEGGHNLGPGAVVVVGAGRSVDLYARDAPVTLLTVQATGSALPGAATASRIVRPADVEDAAVHDPARGFFRMTARLMVNGPSGGYRAFTVGMSTFAPAEGCHDRHRHPHAEELFLLWAGEGTHLSADGTEHPMRSGDLAWVAKNEFHGFRNTGPGVASAVFCYLGVDDRCDAGYEVGPLCAES